MLISKPIWGDLKPNHRNGFFNENLLADQKTPLVNRGPYSDLTVVKQE